MAFITIKSMKQSVKRWRISWFTNRANKLAKRIKGYEKWLCTFNKLVEVYYQLEKI